MRESGVSGVDWRMQIKNAVVAMVRKFPEYSSRQKAQVAAQVLMGGKKSKKLARRKRWERVGRLFWGEVF